MTLKKKVIDLLGTQYKPSDEALIDELIFNFKMLKMAKAGLNNEGLIINTVRDPAKDPYYQRSPYFGIYDTTLKNINMLYSKLNVSPLERRSWTFDESPDDEFDKDFD